MMSETDKLIADAYRVVFGGEPVQGDYLFGRKVLELVRGKQEPVAWQGVHDETDLYYRKPAQGDVRPLYAHPSEPTDLKALAIQCGGLALRDGKCIAMDIDDLAKFAAALAGHSERPAPKIDKLPDFPDDYEV